MMILFLPSLSLYFRYQPHNDIYVLQNFQLLHGVVRLSNDFISKTFQLLLFLPIVRLESQRDGKLYDQQSLLFTISLIQAYSRWLFKDREQVEPNTTILVRTNEVVHRPSHDFLLDVWDLYWVHRLQKITNLCTKDLLHVLDPRIYRLYDFYKRDIVSNSIYICKGACLGKHAYDLSLQRCKRPFLSVYTQPIHQLHPKYGIFAHVIELKDVPNIHNHHSSAQKSSVLHLFCYCLSLLL